MTHAQIRDGAIVAVGAPPSRIYDGDTWWDGTDPASGWHPITTDPHPAPQPDHTYTQTLTVRDGLPVREWTSRPLTPEELAARAAAAQYEADRLAVRQIITDLRAEKARAQAVIDTPNATIKSNPAPYVVDVARAAKRIADAAIDLARYVAP